MNSEYHRLQCELWIHVIFKRIDFEHWALYCILRFLGFSIFHFHSYCWTLNVEQKHQFFMRFANGTVCFIACADGVRTVWRWVTFGFVWIFFSSFLPSSFIFHYERDHNKIQKKSIPRMVCQRSRQGTYYKRKACGMCTFNVQCKHNLNYENVKMYLNPKVQTIFLHVSWMQWKSTCVLEHPGKTRWSV